MILIGITGGIGAGKSEIINYIKSRYNCRIELADQVAHNLEQPGEECFKKLVELFGDGILKDGVIEPKLMAEAMFRDKDMIDKVNDIVHPAVLKYFLDQIDAERRAGEIDFFFIEAALLIECGYEKIVDEIWYIYASEETRRARLKKFRGYTDKKIDNIFASQLPERIFREKCKHTIDNDSDLELAFSQIDEILGGYNGHL